MTDLNTLTKVELEELGREHGVELDRRLSKKKLVEQLTDVLSDAPVDSLDKDELEIRARESGVELDKRLKKETLVQQLKEVEAEPAGQLLTERTKPQSYVGKLFADANGEVLKFATAQAAKSSARRYDGKTIAEKDYFVVRKY